MQGLLQEYRDDVFALAMTLEETIRSMPQDAQSFAIGETLVLSGHDAAMIDAVALLVLSSERNVRMTAVEVLLSMPAYLTPDALRRLIVIRNWLPEGERKGIDAITRAARRKGVECAQWPPVVWQEGDATVAAATYRSALVDGVGNQWLLVLIPSGKRLIWSAVLAKRTVGISDAWSELDVSRKEVAQRLRQIDDLVEVSRAFIDRVIRHYLAVGVEKGVPPSLYLLYTAELIGATDWLPQHMDLRAQLDQLAEAASVPDTADTHQRMLAVRTMQSWFCETSAVDEFLAHTRIRRQDRLLDRLLELHFSDQRALWAEIFMWAALWLLEQKLAPRRAWVSGAVGYLLRMVRMILDGQPLSQIPIMRHIAQRTVWRMRPSTPEGLDFRLLPYQNP
jgi:hypothetical protein